MERVLDWKYNFDARSKLYRVSETSLTYPTKKLWECVPRLDQGSEGACVGFSLANFLSADPLPRIKDGADAFFYYNQAKLIDEWPGEAYDGTSVLAGLKVLKNLGEISEYRWAFSLSDVRTTLSFNQPVVLGTNWYSGMWDTDKNGFVHVTGEYVGGHAILIRGINNTKKFIRLRNSWGRGWGFDGDCKISFEDFKILISQGAEMAVPIKA